MNEFNASLNLLTAANIDIILLDKTKSTEDIGSIPDAVFPNWFTTYLGTLAVFQMEYPNR